MTYTKDQVFKAFRRLYNHNDESDIYLPSDKPEELLDEVDESAIETGCWVKNCNVWISTEQIKSALSELSNENFY